jgi:hypothetical protein
MVGDIAKGKGVIFGLKTNNAQKQHRPYIPKYADTVKRLLKYTDYSRQVAIILRPGLKKKLSIILDRRSWRSLSSEIE